jgi:putative Holliday junction resolvase
VFVRVLGIDLGARRIGLAVSDPTGTLARPYRTVETTPATRKAVRAVLPAIQELVDDEDGLGLVVVGVPTRLDGTAGPLTERARAFAGALGRASRLPVVLQDERLSSREADARLAETEPDWRRRKGRLDAAAAAVILQDHLDARSASGHGEHAGHAGHAEDADHGDDDQGR